MSATGATSGGAVAPAPPRLHDYLELYRLWERQQWRVQEIDFSRDRIDWEERIPAQERRRRLHTLSSFLVGEQLVADELAPVMRAAPRTEMRIFLGTQIADEGRHAFFFRCFFEAIGELEPGAEPDSGGGVAPHLSPGFHTLFEELLHTRVDHLASHPDDFSTLVEVVVIYHMIVEGTLALTSQHFTLLHNEAERTLPGLVAGFARVARDEHRHIAFGTRFLRDAVAASPRHRETVDQMLRLTVPVAWTMFPPPWYEDGMDVFGVALEEHKRFAAAALGRRLKLIGLPGLEEYLG